MTQISRRQALGALGVGLASSLQAARPQGYLVENATHMFSDDQTRFPYHSSATYRPPPSPIERYVTSLKEAKLDHTVIVQSEVYQDDHSYLEYCFQHEPSPGYLKGTCLFDPIDPKTPARIQSLVKKLNNRIVTIRIHELRPAGAPPTTTGPIRDRGLQTKGMKDTWRAMRDLGLMVQMQTIPYYAPQIGALASEFHDMPVIIDHLAFPARGTPAEYEEVIKLSRLPNVHMKVSSLTEKEKPLVKRLYEAYGADRLIWGSYGGNMASFEKALALAENVFDYASEDDRVKIRGLNAMKLFRFPMR